MVIPTVIKAKRIPKDLKTTKSKERNPYRSIEMGTKKSYQFQGKGEGE